MPWIRQGNVWGTQQVVVVEFDERSRQLVTLALVFLEDETIREGRRDAHDKPNLRQCRVSPDQVRRDHVHVLCTLFACRQPVCPHERVPFEYHSLLHAVLWCTNSIWQQVGHHPIRGLGSNTAWCVFLFWRGFLKLERSQRLPDENMRSTSACAPPCRFGGQHLATGPQQQKEPCFSIQNCGSGHRFAHSSSDCYLLEKYCSMRTDMEFSFGGLGGGMCSMWWTFAS